LSISGIEEPHIVWLKRSNPKTKKKLCVLAFFRFSIIGSVRYDTIKEGRDPLAANQATNKCTVFREFVASGLRNFKYELNHVDSEEKNTSCSIQKRSVFKKNLRVSSN
jgi:hypothetical protein